MSDLNSIFSALGDDTRRAILARLMEGEAPLSRLAEPFSMSQTAVTRHVRVLEEAGLVRVEKRGRVRHCSLTPVPFADAASWLESYRPFWEAQMENLARYLKTEGDKE